MEGRKEGKKGRKEGRKVGRKEGRKEERKEGSFNAFLPEKHVSKPSAHKINWQDEIFRS